MSEKIIDKLKQKVEYLAEKSFIKVIEKASKGYSLEILIKSLITDKIMAKLKILIKKPVIKKSSKIIVKKIIDRFWEKHKESLEKVLIKLK